MDKRIAEILQIEDEAARKAAAQEYWDGLSEEQRQEWRRVSDNAVAAFHGVAMAAQKAARALSDFWSGFLEENPDFRMYVESLGSDEKVTIEGECDG